MRAQGIRSVRVWNRSFALRLRDSKRPPIARDQITARSRAVPATDPQLSQRQAPPLGLSLSWCVCVKGYGPLPLRGPAPSWVLELQCWSCPQGVHPQEGAHAPRGSMSPQGGGMPQEGVCSSKTKSPTQWLVILPDPLCLSNCLSVRVGALCSSRSRSSNLCGYWRPPPLQHSAL